MASQGSGGGTLQNPSIIMELNRLVYEYLDVTGMSKTLSLFEAECQQKSLPFPPMESMVIKSTFSQSASSQLMSTFDAGDLDAFLEIWTLFLSHIQITSEDMKKLEVYIRVYFAIWPKIQERTEEEQTKAMANLKAYFEDNSSQLSRDPSILPLFALPFVKDPKTHPIFKELFQNLWSVRLRAQLEATLTKYYELLQENIGYHSKLAGLVLNGQVGSQSSGSMDGVIQYHQDRFLQLMGTYRKVRKLLRGTRESYGKLLKVSNELICGLEEAINGSTLSVEPTVQKCFSIFPELFTPELQEDGKPNTEYFKRLSSAAIFNNIFDSDVSLFFIGIADLGPDSLNYAKIKDTLSSDRVNQSEKLCLLQSLRWLLTRTSPKCRELAMEAFVAADLLGLQNTEKECRSKMFACMLSRTPTYLKECFARLLNATASIKSGRTYLTGNDYSLGILVKSLATFKGENESYICQMVIATLQKLSLRKNMRLEMIDRKVIQWITAYLKAELGKKQVPRDPDNGNTEMSYNPYLMEYGWALLMNLCLHEEAKQASTPIAPDILTSVIQMLRAKPAPDVAPYVVSTLYSLLRNPDVFSIAKRMRLHDTLTEITGDSKTEMAHHLKKLVEVLKSKGNDRISTSGEVDYDDDDNVDPEEFEAELEVTEAWVASLEPANHVGDDLLIREYLIHREVVVPQTTLQKLQVNGGVYTRPTTPQSTYVSSKPAEIQCGSGISPCRPIKSSRALITRQSLSKSQMHRSVQYSSSKGDENANSSIRRKSSGTRHLKSTPSGNASARTPVSPPLTNKSKSILNNNIRKKNSAQRLESTAEMIKDKDKLILNKLSGKYEAFDPGMYSDNIFASVPSKSSNFRTADGSTGNSKE